MVQTVEHQPSKCEAQSSNLSITKKKKGGWEGARERQEKKET
jgi:hypothetical protein